MNSDMVIVQLEEKLNCFNFKITKDKFFGMPEIRYDDKIVMELYVENDKIIYFNQSWKNVDQLAHFLIQKYILNNQEEDYELYMLDFIEYESLEDYINLYEVYAIKSEFKFDIIY